MKKITLKNLAEFENFLINDEKSKLTVKKYIHDVTEFSEWLKGKKVGKPALLEYKDYLIKVYKVTSVNSVISSLNCFFTFIGWYDCRLKSIKIQQYNYIEDKKVLTKEDYNKLIKTAKENNNERLYFLMQTLCSMGLRVSELSFVTLEALTEGRVFINNKGKVRQVLLPDGLCNILLSYAKEQKITSGPVFVTRLGNPVDRSNVWDEMKKLSESAGIPKEKVFPHNFRHLFARTYYCAQKDIVHLADILGHSDVNTTRIYTAEKSETHKKEIEKLGLLNF